MDLHVTFASFFMFCVILLDQEKKIWSFDLSVYEDVQRKVGELSPDVVIGQLPNFVLKLLKQGYLIHSLFHRIVKIILKKMIDFQRKKNWISCVLMRLKRNSRHSYSIFRSMALHLQFAMVADA